jgi:hypothetical protein
LGHSRVPRFAPGLLEAPLFAAVAPPCQRNALPADGFSLQRQA